MTMPRSYPALLLAALATVTALAVAAACGGVGTTTAGLAPTEAAPSGKGSEAPPSDQDRIWMKKTHQGNLAEIQAGRLAERKGTARAVKELGKTLVKDHATFDGTLTQVADRLGVELPESVSPEQKRAAVALEGASREDFDRLFLTTMRKAHRAAIGDTLTEVKRGTSPAAKAAAAKALPAFRHHLEMAKAAMDGN